MNGLVHDLEIRNLNNSLFAYYCPFELQFYYQVNLRQIFCILTIPLSIWWPYVSGAVAHCKRLDNKISGIEKTTKRKLRNKLYIHIIFAVIQWCRRGERGNETLGPHELISDAIPITLRMSGVTRSWYTTHMQSTPDNPMHESLATADNRE